MKEVKFRAWSVIDQEYINNKVNYLIDLNGQMFYQFGSRDLEHIGHNELVIQRYTGLKDAGEVEIYDGDIIQFNFRDRWGHVDTFLGQVIWDEYMWLVETPEGDQYSLNRIHRPIIFGNIFENPNLI